MEGGRGGGRGEEGGRGGGYRYMYELEDTTNCRLLAAL